MPLLYETSQITRITKATYIFFSPTLAIIKTKGFPKCQDKEFFPELMKIILKFQTKWQHLLK